MNFETTQMVFPAIVRLGALCATPGITEDVKTKANKQIETLLGILQPEFQKLSANSNGLIV